MIDREQVSVPITGVIDTWDEFLKAMTPQFKRGDRVLVSDESSDDGHWCERTYLTTIEGSSFPYLVVDEGSSEEFASGKKFHYTCYKYIKPVPKENQRLKELENALKQAQEALEAYKKEKNV